MQRWIAGIAFVLCQTLASQAKAEESAGPELGLRTGYAVPSGRVEVGRRLRDTLTFALPVHVDLGYRFRNWFFGGYGQYALGFESRTSASTCPGCTHSWLRIGLQAQYSFLHSADSELWAGLGSGQQWLNTDIDKDRREAFQAAGYEYLVFQLGGAVHIAEGVTLGPFTSVSLGEYVRTLQTCQRDELCPATRQRVEEPTPSAQLHLWFVSGVRATLLP